MSESLHTKDKNKNTKEKIFVIQKINKTLDFLLKEWYPYNVVLYDKEQTMKLFFKKACIVIVCMLLVLSLSSNSVYADEPKLMKITRQETGPQGGTIIFNVLLINLNENNKKVSSFNCYFNIDENVFEDVTVDSIVKESDGKVSIASTGEKLDVYDLTQATPESISSTGSAGVFFNGNPSSGNDNKIMIDFGTDVTADAVGTKVLSLKLKIKDNATVGTHENAIELNDVQLFCQDSEMVEIKTDKPFPVTVTAKQSETGSTEEPKNDQVRIVSELCRGEDNNKDYDWFFVEAASENGIESVDVTLDGKKTTYSMSDSDDANLFLKKCIKLEEGKHTVVITARDKKGNQETVTKEFTAKSYNNASSGAGTNNNNASDDVVRNVNADGTDSSQSQVPANSTDKTVAQKILPATGSAITIAIPVIILVIAAYVCYTKYLKIKDIK